MQLSLYKKALAAIFFYVLLIPGVSKAIDITPGYIAGKINVGNFSISDISLYASGGGYTSSKTSYNSNNYSMTVQGGEWDYNLDVSCNINGADKGRTYLSFSPRILKVPAGSTVINDYNNLGIIRFQFNITGDTFTSFSFTSSAIKAASLGQEKTYTITNTATYPSGQYFDVPVVANKEIAVSGVVRLGTQYGAKEFSINAIKDVEAGEVVVIPLNMNFVAPPPPPPVVSPPSVPPSPGPLPQYGNIAGKAQLVGVPSSENVSWIIRNDANTDYFYLGQYWGNPVSYFGTIRAPFPNNQLTFRTSLSSQYQTEQFFLPYIDGDPANNYVPVEPDKTTVKDFLFDTGVFSGEIKLSGSVARQGFMKSDSSLFGGLGIYGVANLYDPVLGWVRQPANGGQAQLHFQRQDRANFQPNLPFRAYLTEGDWAPTRVSLSKYDPQASSHLLFTDNNYNFDGKYNTYGRTIQVTPGQNTNTDMEYCLGSAYFRFHDISGGVTKNPYVRGTGTHYNALGKMDIYIDAIMASSRSNSLEVPEIEIFGPPADYDLTVIQVTTQDNSLINFPPMKISLGCGNVKHYDIPGPDLKVNNPEPEFVTNALSVAVTGNAQGDSPIAAITVNGQGATISPTGSATVNNEVAFSHNIEVAEGKNSITTTVIDNRGAKSDDQRAIYVDRWVPMVSLTAPKDGDSFLCSTSTVPVEVTAADQGYGFSLQVLLDGNVIYQANGGGNDTVPVLLSYSATIGPLAVGDHVITARVIDRAGNSIANSVTIKSYSDQWPPTVQIFSPVDGAYLGNVPVPLDVQAADQGNGFGFSVSVDGIQIHKADGPADIASPASLNFNGTIGPLAGGDHLITAVATDLAGFTATAASAIHVDPWAPTVNITTPADGTFFSSAASNIPLRVDASDRGYGYSLQVYLDDKLIHQADGPADLAAPVVVTFNNVLGPLPLGNHTINAVITDRAGNSTSSTVNIISYLAVGVVVKPEARHNTDEGTTTIFVQLPNGLTSTASLVLTENREISADTVQYPVAVKYSATDDKVLLKFHRTPELMADALFTVEGKFYPNPSNPSEWYYWRGSDTTKR